MSSTGGSDITWSPIRSDKTLISKVNNGLSLNMDGYYFLNLQVAVGADCGSITDQSSVSLVHIPKDNKPQTPLQGSINKETNTTGILSKVVECGAGERLIFNISEPLLNCVDKNESKTHLDIIFMPRL